MPDGIESITVSRPGFTALTGPLHPINLIRMAHSPAYFERNQIVSPRSELDAGDYPSPGVVGALSGGARRREGLVRPAVGPPLLVSARYRTRRRCPTLPLF